MRQNQPTRVLGRARTLALLAFLVACGPDNNGRDGCRLKPTFIVTITPKTGALPPNTRVDFQYGGGDETFQLDVAHTPEVVFCEPHPMPSDIEGAGGAGGVEITEIVCELWTGGSTDVEVTAEGFLKLQDYTLRTDRDLCTVSDTIELLPERPTR